MVSIEVQMLCLNADFLRFNSNDLQLEFDSVLEIQFNLNRNTLVDRRPI